MADTPRKPLGDVLSVSPAADDSVPLSGDEEPAEGLTETLGRWDGLRFVQEDEMAAWETYWTLASITRELTFYCDAFCESLSTAADRIGRI